MQCLLRALFVHGRIPHFPPVASPGQGQEHDAQRVREGPQRTVLFFVHSFWVRPLFVLRVSPSLFHAARPRPRWTRFMLPQGCKRNCASCAFFSRFCAFSSSWKRGHSKGLALCGYKDNNILDKLSSTPEFSVCSLSYAIKPSSNCSGGWTENNVDQKMGA